EGERLTLPVPDLLLQPQALLRERPRPLRCAGAEVNRREVAEDAGEAEPVVDRPEHRGRLLVVADRSLPVAGVGGDMAHRAQAPRLSVREPLCAEPFERLLEDDTARLRPS